MEVFNIIFGFISVVIAGFLAHIAKNQYKIQRDKLKFELYEKRFRVYSATEALFENFIIDTKVNYQDYSDFIRGTYGYKFLFDEDVISFIEKAKEEISKILVLNTGFTVVRFGSDDHIQNGPEIDKTIN